MVQLYEIIRQEPRMYLDGGMPVNGYIVYARLTQFDEIVSINVPSLDVDVVHTAIDKVLQQRINIQKLGHYEAK